MIRAILTLVAMSMALTACPKPKPKPEAAPDYDATRRRAAEAHEARELKPQ